MTIELPSKKPGMSTREFIYTTLRDQILKLELEPGTVISEKEISLQLEVSRTPVREAFLKLSQEELLEVYPQKGTIVSHINLKQVEEARFIRESLEKATVALACESFSGDDLFQLESNLKMQELSKEKNNHTNLFELDEEFHHIIFRGCDKERTWMLIQQVNTHFKRLRMLRLAVNHDWEVIIQQHNRIFGAIRDREVNVAQETMGEHLRLVQVEKEELYANYPTYFK